MKNRIVRAFAIAALLMTTVSGSALAAKAPDEPAYMCFVFFGRVICVQVN
jgi:hypothetical protein